MNELKIHVRLKEARSFLNLNQLRIATDLKIQQKTVSEIENGKLINIPNKYIYYFYEKGISLEWIYDGVGFMTKNELSTQSSDNHYESNLESLSDMFAAKKELKQSDKYEKKNKVAVELNDETISDDYSQLIDSKDVNIKTLLSYVHSQEKMIEFLQQIIKKELKL